MHLSTQKLARTLVGKTITKVSLNPQRGEDVRRYTEPIIYLSDGSSLWFVVEETGGSDYGVALCWSPGHVEHTGKVDTNE